MRFLAQIFEVHHEAIEHLRDILDNPVDFARSHADAVAIDGRIRAAVDDGAAACGDLDPVPVTPEAGINVEIAFAVTVAPRIVQQSDRH